MPFLVVIILGIKHLVLGTVNAAAMEMQFGDWDKSEKLLSYVVKPEWLRFGYHGMYYLMKSRIAFQKNDLTEAEKLSNKALSLDMPDDMKATVYLQLVGVAGQRQQTAKIEEYLKQLKKLPNITQPMIKDQIKQLELMVKGQHPDQKKLMQHKQQQMQHFMTKRRR
jgi:uncharacterized protein HemY